MQMSNNNSNQKLRHFAPDHIDELVTDVQKAIIDKCINKEPLNADELEAWNYIKERKLFKTVVPALTLENGRICLSRYARGLINWIVNQDANLFVILDLLEYCAITGCPTSLLYAYSPNLSKKIPADYWPYINRELDVGESVKFKSNWTENNILDKIIKLASGGGFDLEQLPSIIRRLVNPSNRVIDCVVPSEMVARIRGNEGLKKAFKEAGIEWINLDGGDKPSAIIAVYPAPNFANLNDLLLSDDYSRVASYFAQTADSVSLNKCQALALHELVKKHNAENKWHFLKLEDGSGWRAICSDEAFKFRISSLSFSKHNSALYKRIAGPLLKLFDNERDISFEKLETVVGKLLLEALPKQFNEGFAAEHVEALEQSREKLTSRLKDAAQFNVSLDPASEEEDALYSLAYQKRIMEEAERVLDLREGKNSDGVEYDKEWKGAGDEDDENEWLSKDNNFAIIMATLLNELKSSNRELADRLIEEWKAQCNEVDFVALQTILAKTSAPSVTTVESLENDTSFDWVEDDVAQLEEQDGLLFELLDRLDELSEYIKNDEYKTLQNEEGWSLRRAVAKAQRTAQELRNLHYYNPARFALAVEDGAVSSKRKNYLTTSLYSTLSETLQRTKTVITRDRSNVFKRFIDWLIKLLNPSADRFKAREALSEKEKRLTGAIRSNMVQLR